jgi:cell cycle sensor histidine kinase DivJ
VYPESVRAYIDALVHPSARHDVLTAARHRAFIAVRLLGVLLTLAAIPPLLVVRGAPAPLEALILAWLLGPLLIVAYLSRTGNFAHAHLLSAAMLAGLVAVVAGMSGGVASFAAPWLAVIPLEAALSATRRVVLATIAFAVAASLGLWGLDAAGLLFAHSSSSTAHLLGILSAALYAGVVALGVTALVRRGERVKLAEEARYHLLAQNMSDLITRHAKNGAVTFISPAAERLVGSPASSLLGHGLFERVHIADRPAFLTAITDAARGRSASVQYRLRRGRTEEGREPVFIWVETRCRSLANGAAGEGEVVAVTHDISRIKQDTIDLEAAHATAEQANAAKSRFLATVSHELRTPLNAIIGFSEMLRNERALGLDPARREDYARMIHESGAHLLAVVNGILDVSRIEAGRFELSPEPLAVGPLVESCYEMMLLRAEQAGVRLGVRIEPELPEIIADKLALRQVMINLISNAVKFTPRGGMVDVSVRWASGMILFLIADTGIGISESDLEQVGNPFFQAASSYDRPHEGTGLGLSVVKGLVELHGGELEIKSRLGEGTRVIVRLPRECPAAKPKPAPVVERLAGRTIAHEFEQVKRRA